MVHVNNGRNHYNYLSGTRTKLAYLPHTQFKAIQNFPYRMKEWKFTFIQDMNYEICKAWTVIDKLYLNGVREHAT